MRHILITGVSTGIGYGLAHEFVRQGYHVYGSVRKPADADRLRDELEQHFTPLLFDVMDTAAIQAAAEQVEDAIGGTGLVGLINNAGLATSGPLMHQPLDDLRYQFEVNVIGQIAVTQAFLPLLGADSTLAPNPGRILMMSSVGGKVVAPFLGAYSASKFALEALSHALRRELQLYGIDVVILGPGAVKTPIWEKDSATQIADAYADTDFAEAIGRFQTFFTRQADDGFELDEFSRIVRDIFETPRPKTRYALVKEPLKNWWVPRLLPDRTLDRAMAKNMRMG